MQQILNELISTKGVKGAFISNLAGQVTSTIGEPCTLPLKSISLELLNFLKSRKIGGKFRERIQFTFDNTIILLQEIASGFVVVMCEPDVSTALLRLTLNVAMARFVKN